MPKYTTTMRAINLRTGSLESFIGPNINAVSRDIAEEWCKTKAPYLSIAGVEEHDAPLIHGTSEPMEGPEFHEAHSLN